MSDQMDLFGGPEPPPPLRRRQRVRHTSRAALSSVEPAQASLRGQMLDFIRGRGAHGATLDEAAVGIPMLLQTACGTRQWLEEHGFLRNSGRERRTRTGRMAIVWLAP